MSFAPNHFKFLRQLSTSTLIVVLSVALTLGAWQTFPQLLPSLVLANTLNQVLLAEPDLVKTKTADVNEVRRSPVVSRRGLSDPHSFVTAVVKRVGAAVVRIDTERTVVNPFSDLLFENPFLRDLLGEDVFERIPREYLQKGQGSGVIIDRQGIILTNAHVVSGADTVKVSLQDGRSFEGKVRGMDKLSDLAVVKINGNNLPIATLGNSSELEVGDWAIAMGNPLGLDSTVTLGIISTLDRSSAQVGISDLRLNFIQTDAAINPGNSGGPLLNARGEVIGINTAIRAGAEGIGFAIPIDNAKAIKERLIRGETIAHPYIGIQMLTLTTDLARQLNRDPNANISLPEIEGVLLISIMPDSPAMVAGLRRGDVITAIDDIAIADADQLQDLIDQSQIGQPMKISIYRGEQTKQLSVIPQAIKPLTTNH